MRIPKPLGVLFTMLLLLSACAVRVPQTVEVINNFQTNSIRISRQPGRISQNNSYRIIEYKDIPLPNRRILLGAEAQAAERVWYDREMLTHQTPLLYSNGVHQIQEMFPYGDVAPNKGVCTDLVVRALRNAGVGLQMLVYQDMRAHAEYYGVPDPDRFIEHRRVRVLQKFFEKNFTILSSIPEVGYRDWLPGDIVIWDTGDEKNLHIGILSRRRDVVDGRPWIIHNAGYLPFVFPGVTAVQDRLWGWRIPFIYKNEWKVLGRYRLQNRFLL